MVRSMRLRGKITLEDDKRLTFSGTLYDGVSFTLNPGQFDVQLQDDFTPSRRTVDGWLYVQEQSRQDDRAYICLPKPTINHGHYILVKEVHLVPRHSTINDFNPKKISPKNSQKQEESTSK